MHQRNNDLEDTRKFNKIMNFQIPAPKHAVVHQSNSMLIQSRILAG